MRIAYCNTPKIGGTYNFYRNLFDALTPLGMEVLCVSAGPDAAAWRDDDPFVYGRCVKVAAEVSDLKQAAVRLLAWIEEQAIDVFVPMNSRIGFWVLPYFP